MASEESVAQKRCTKCGEVKDLKTEFSNCRKAADGKAFRCKACASAYYRSYYNKNAARLRSRAARYGALNRDKIAARMDRWRKSNKPKLDEYSAAYREANRESIYAWRGKWQKENPVKYRAQRAEYRIRRQEADARLLVRPITKRQ